MQLHQLKRATPNKKPKRVGRGGIRGKTSGRGTKGQKARAGHRIRTDIRERMKKLPKLRGRGRQSLKSIQDRPIAVNVAVLERAFEAGDTVTPSILVERKIIRLRKGALPVVKILSQGDLTKKLVIEGCTLSVQAREKVEKAGGSVAVK